jgi:hypothetical protein
MCGHVRAEQTVLKLTLHGDKWLALSFSSVTPEEEHTASIQCCFKDPRADLDTLEKEKSS